MESAPTPKAQPSREVHAQRGADRREQACLARSSCSLVATAGALYADQAGEQDWHRENIGRVTHAASKQKALFVVTEAGDRSLVASLGARTGTLNWRTALPPNEKGHAIALTDKAVITLSGEGKCRAWAQAGGALLWEQPALPGVSAQALAVVEANKQCTVAVLRGRVAYGTAYRCGKRRVVRRGDEDAQLAAALPRGASWNCGRLPHKGRVLVAGFVNGKALLASLDVLSGQSVQALSAVLGDVAAEMVWRPGPGPSSPVTR